MAHTDEQPAPKKTTCEPCWPMVIRYVDDNYEGDPVPGVIADMEARDKTGRERYGGPLTAFNGRNALVDCYQELLDGAVYLRAFLDEQGINPDGARQPIQHRTLTIQEELAIGMFRDLIDNIIDLKAVL